MTSNPSTNPKSRPPLQGILQYLRSMRFGILLLVIISVFSLIGSLLPQDRPVNYYAQNFPALSEVIVGFGLNRIFSSAIFIGLLALLCLNLVLCTIVRLRTKGQLLPTLQRRLSQQEPQAVQDPQALKALLTKRGFKPVRAQPGLFSRGLAGTWGSALVHLSFLLILVFGAYLLYTAKTDDITIFTGETASLPDGSQITLNAFSTQDEAGRLDYISDISFQAQGDANPQSARLRVNQPVKAGNYTLYQLSYGIYGRVIIAGAGGSREILLDRPRDLTMDINTPVLYQGLFPDYTVDDNGDFTVSMDASKGYPNPVYLIDVVRNDQPETGVLRPGEQLELGNTVYHFTEPQSFSVIRAKTLAPMLWALYFAFFLLTLALYLTFFMVPSFISVDESGYRIASTKPDPLLARELAQYHPSPKDETL